MMGRKRDDYLSTNGCRIFSTKIDKQLVKFTELGGEEFYAIWHYYFLDVSLRDESNKTKQKVLCVCHKSSILICIRPAIRTPFLSRFVQVMGVIFVIDSSSDQYTLERSKQTFGSIMSNDLLMGKPTLIIANKQDVSGALDSLDICDYFEVEYLANLFRTPCYVEGSGKFEESYDSQVARNSLSWLIKTINGNYKSIQNKIRFLRVVTQNESHSSSDEIPFKYRRPLTGKKRSVLCSNGYKSRLSLRVFLARAH